MTMNAWMQELLLNCIREAGWGDELDSLLADFEVQKTVWREEWLQNVKAARANGYLLG